MIRQAVKRYGMTMLDIYAVLRNVKKTPTDIVLLYQNQFVKAELPAFNHFEEALKPFLSAVL